MNDLIPYDVQLTHDQNVHANSMAIVSSQRQPATSGGGYYHQLSPGVYMVSFSYDGAQSATLRIIDPDGNARLSMVIPSGTAGIARSSQLIRVSVTNLPGDRIHILSSTATGGSARATFSIYPVQVYNPEMVGGGG